MEIETSAARVHLICAVNGEDVRLDLDPRESLLDALRERLALTGTKKGCDQGHCGACTVHVGGRRVPVNLDIQQIDVDFVDEPDLRFNAVGVKGAGEVCMVGVSAAIATAVYHATVRRVRRRPIRLEDVL